MKGLKNREKNKITRGFKLSDIFAQLIFALCITCVMFILTPADDFIIKEIVKNPLTIILNIIPVFLVGMLLQSIFGRLRLAIILNSCIYFIIYIIHRTKVIYRNAPLVFSDFKLGFEAANMVKQSFLPDKLAIIVPIIALIIILFLTKFNDKSKISLKQRIAGTFSIVIVALCLYNFVYAKDNLYYSLPQQGNPYNLLNHFNSKGFNYTFIHNLKDSIVRPPVGYNRDEIKNYESIDKSEELSVIQYNQKPNIIWIMGEAFTDISQNPVFSFDEGYDPNENFKKLQSEAILSGRIVTPSFGGGTGDTEFDVLTGTLTTDVSVNGSVAFNSVKRDINSLPRFLKLLGYDTRAFHPGFEWFYRRNEVYPKIGFDESFFLEDIENPDIKGEYVSEKQFSEIFINRFEKSIEENDAPIFDYAVDIQNHGPYYYDKYKKSYPYYCDYTLSEEAANMFGTYFLGVKDMDNMIGEVYNMIKSKDEPIIMVFYGDHLPTFGNNPSAYDEIEKKLNWDNLEKEIEYYSTPYLILANDKGREYLNKENIEIDHGDIISTNYLAGTVLDLLDYSKADNFFTYNSELRKKLPIISRHFIFDGEKAYPRDKVGSEAAEIYTKYRKYEYYRIND